jgi:hypothetical protein
MAGFDPHFDCRHGLLDAFGVVAQAGDLGKGREGRRRMRKGEGEISAATLSTERTQQTYLTTADAANSSMLPSSDAVWVALITSSVAFMAR